MRIGICSLCLNEKPLLRKAHIIPDWMYFGLFDDKHKIALIDLDKKEYPKFPSTGLYDSDIFCQTCDGDILGKLEDYGKTILCNDKGFVNFFESKGITNTGGLKCAQLDKIVYLKFKLFLVSLIWKMHISKQPFFSQVDLGAFHSEKMRSRLYNNDKIAENEYEVAILMIENIPELISKMIIVPRKIKQSNNTYYVSLINGLVFMFNISANGKMNLITKSRLRESGVLPIPLLEGEMAKLFYDSLGKENIRRQKDNY